MRCPAPMNTNAPNEVTGKISQIVETAQLAKARLSTLEKELKDKIADQIKQERATYDNLTKDLIDLRGKFV